MPYIKSECAERIKDQTDIVKVIQKFCPDLKKKGANYVCKSPFTQEKTASFTVSPAKQIFKDFSSGKGGDAISFLMEHERMEYPQALEYLAALNNVQIEYENEEVAKKKQQEIAKKEELRPILLASLRAYQKAYNELPKDHHARAEVEKKRGYTKEEIVEYQIGYAPGGTFLYDRLKESGKMHPGKDLGLVGEKADRYWDRVIYPIHDKNGLLIGLAGRDVSGREGSAKWINSSESMLYHKEKVWYGLHKAYNEISNRGKAWIVEGYNDVIAWQCNGLPNTIAPCGTAISRLQMKLLARYCSHVVLCLDDDKAGIKSMLKHIPEFLEENFRVHVVSLGGMDPDDYVRANPKVDLNKQFPPEKMVDGFKFLMDHNLKGDEISITAAAKDLCKIIVKTKDTTLQEVYSLWLQKEAKVNKTTFNNWMKIEKEKEVEVTNHSNQLYHLPKEVKLKLEDIQPTIEKYGLFQANNKIWIKQGDDPPFNFRAVSNFSIEIIQHMQDEKMPMKLIRIKNIFGHEKIFDIPSEQVNTPLAFDNAMTAHGNFLWTGSRQDHQKLRAYLFDSMGTGRKIEVLGWQQDGFWSWNNVTQPPGAPKIEISENGVFTKDGISYYVPSANEIYKHNTFKYEPQKKVVLTEPNMNFQVYINQMVKVHRNHAITGIMFTVASVFQDIVTKEIKNFPMLFLYGPASSGKDQLADCCQSFFGSPQTAINLEGGVSTIKAQVREFAQFSNMICHLSEYKTGDPKLDGILKGLWDRRGYKRGTIDSHVGTESIPILSSVLMTANYYPEAEPLITRFIIEEMNKNTFNEDEQKEYDKLADLTAQGLSGFTNTWIRHRDKISNNFQKTYRKMKGILGERNPDTKSRMLGNAAVLCAFYEMLEGDLGFPFSLEMLMSHLEEGMKQQSAKLTSANIITKWWDCFIASLRGNIMDQLRVDRDVKVEGQLLYFNFTNTYNKVQRQWYLQFRENAPLKTEMLTALKKENAFHAQEQRIDFGTGRDDRLRTSALVMKLDDLPSKEEITAAMFYQRTETGSTEASPATQGDNPFKEETKELPF